MLFDFCSRPNEQVIAAINIYGREMTIFAYPNEIYELGAFRNYLVQTLSLEKNISVRTEVIEDNHLHLQHQFTSHLSDLDHFHFIFDTNIDKNIFKNVINTIQHYNDNFDLRVQWRSTNKGKAARMQQMLSGLTWYERITMWWKGYATEHYSTKNILDKKNLIELKQYVGNFKNSASSKITDPKTVIDFRPMQLPKIILLNTLPSVEDVRAVTCSEVLNPYADPTINSIAAITCVSALVLFSVFSINNRCRKRPTKKTPSTGATIISHRRQA
jgi:hypothetical protein